LGRGGVFLKSSFVPKDYERKIAVESELKNLVGSNAVTTHPNNLILLAPELLFLILAHPVYKM